MALFFSGMNSKLGRKTTRAKMGDSGHYRFHSLMGSKPDLEAELCMG